MRLLIAVYSVLGAALLGLAVGIAFLGIGLGRFRLPPPGRTEAFVLAAIGALVEALPLVAAHGLRRGWRWVWLILLGVSWWSVAVSAVMSGLALAILTGLLDERDVGLGEPPAETLATA